MMKNFLRTSMSSVSLPENSEFKSGSAEGLMVDPDNPGKISYQIDLLVAGGKSVENVVISAPAVEGKITCSLEITYNIRGFEDIKSFVTSVDSIIAAEKIFSEVSVSVNDVDLTSEEQIAVLKATVVGGSSQSHQWFKGISSEAGVLIRGATSSTLRNLYRRSLYGCRNIYSGSKIEATGNVAKVLGDGAGKSREGFCKQDCTKYVR